MNSIIASLYVLLGIASFSFAQAPFQNLDFETVIGDRLPGEEFPSEGEFPGWGYFSPVEHTGYGPQKILRINSNDAIAGRYSITMFAGLAFDYYNGLLAEPLTVSPASISQTGVVPSDSRSISIQASSPPGIWSLSLGGTEIELAQISSERWAGNFPRSLAGTSPTLSIVMHPELGDALENNG